MRYRTVPLWCWIIQWMAIAALAMVVYALSERVASYEQSDRPEWPNTINTEDE